MATLSWFKNRRCWRINYTLTLRSRKIRRAKYAQGKPEATLLATQLSRVEQATRTGMATQQEIEEWVERGWIAEEQAGLAFTGYAESTQRKRRVHLQATDYDHLLNAYGEYAARVCKGGALGRNFAKNMSQARMVVAWMKAEWPTLSDLTPEGVRARLFQMKDQYTESSIRHFLIKAHLLLDQALALGMIAQNPARQVRLRRDLNVRLKTSQERRILTEEEIRGLFQICAQYPHYLNGSLPTLVHLGLYAGLRNEEMCQLQWPSIEWQKRILTIQASLCALTGETWVPKDYEARRVDVKQECIEQLRREQERQQRAGILGPFVLSAGRYPKSVAAGQAKPMHPDTLSKAFARMIQEAGWDVRITVYSLRHTYATMALRSGVDIRTLQKRMGHSDLKTTMEYLHFIEPESHPMDKLPY